MAILLGKLSALSSDFIYGEERNSALLQDNVSPFDRVVDIEPLAEVIDECKERFTDANGEAAPTESDRWLAPRLHATLRLTKREALSQDVWNFLAVYAFPDYVAWRWGRSRQIPLSTATDVKKHPFKRLWWGAEMFRNGSSYQTVEAAYARSDVPNTSLSTRVMNNRAVALAVLRYFDKHKLSSRQVNPVSTQLRTAAVTVALDFASPNSTEALELDREWLNTTPYAPDIIEMPIGPQHGYVGESEICRAEQMLERVIDLERVRAYRRQDSLHNEDFV